MKIRNFRCSHCGAVRQLLYTSSPKLPKCKKCGATMVFSRLVVV